MLLTLPGISFDLYKFLAIVLYNISLINDDFPEPDTPVTTTNFPSGISTFIAPRSLQSIGDYAFSNARRLQIIDLSKATRTNVSTISVGKSAFAWIPASLKPNSLYAVGSIGDGAFQEGGPGKIEDENRITLNLPNCHSIGHKVFYLRYEVKKVIIPDDCTYYSDSFFISGLSDAPTITVEGGKLIS